MNKKEFIRESIKKVDELTGDYRGFTGVSRIPTRKEIRNAFSYLYDMVTKKASEGGPMTTPSNHASKSPLVDIIERYTLHGWGVSITEIGYKPRGRLQVMVEFNPRIGEIIHDNK